MVSKFYSKTTVSLVIGVLLSLSLHNTATAQWPIQMVEDEKSIHWVDSVYEQMSLEERIGQLIMIRAHSNLGENHIAEVKRQIEQYHVGAVCFFQGNPLEQARLTNKYQELSNIPMLVAMDAEWGLGMRFREDGISFPRQLTLGAIQDNNLIYQKGREIARQLNRIGVHINFAPVIDVNNNPANPVINDRSFGEVKEQVVVKGHAYMRGLQNGGVMACGKHFPGHGDTDVDSHFDLPVINHSVERLDSIELFPFKQLIPQGLQSIMIAHLHIPAYDSTPNLPTTLSKDVVTGILKEELRFKGLIITDAMEMKGVTKYFPAGEAEVKSILAGNDVICLPADVDKTFSALKKAYEEGRLSPDRLEESVKKILSAKYFLGLNNYEPVELENLSEEVNHPKALALKSELIENALTLVRDEQEIFPIDLDNEKKRTTIAIGTAGKNKFQHRLDDYADWEHHHFLQDDPQLSSQEFTAGFSDKDLVVVSLHNMGRFLSGNYSLKNSTIDFVNRLASHSRVALVIFGSPYSLRFFDDIETVLVAYDDGEMFRDFTAQGLSGAFAITGRLPVTASERSRAGDGLDIPSQFRLGFVLPERVGMCSNSLKEIDKLVEEMIADRAAPGCQIVVARKGKIVYRHSFGYHTYERIKPVEHNHIYDIASLTKVLSTTYSSMILSDRDRLNVFRDIGYYLPELRASDKGPLQIHDIMVHRSGLQAWIPFYQETVQNTRGRILHDPEIYSNSGPSEQYALRVSDQLWINSEYPSVLWSEIINSPLGRANRYRYSDLGFYMMAELIDRVSGSPIDEFANREIFHPLNLRRTMYNPREKFSPDQIVPSEDDRYFRGERLRGYVHDMGAAMLGGVSGHAGLFSNATEVAVLMQSLLNGGYYGGVRLVDPATVSLFTTRPQMETRRGIGFDMQELNKARRPNMSEYASYRTFGHLGFTGTAAWADPQDQLIFVILSNRTFPTMENRKFIRDNYRIRIQDKVYRAIVEPGQSGGA